MLKGLVVGLVLYFVVSSAQATPITNTIVVGDKEWAQVDLFTSLSWNQINAVCPSGVCGNGTLNGLDMGGWAWAHIGDVAQLFRSLLPFPASPDMTIIAEASSTWAPSFLGMFAPTGGGGGCSNCVHLEGWMSDLNFRGNNGLLAGVTDFPDQMTDYAYTSNGLPRDSVEHLSGAWVYRPATLIPEPGSFPLFGLAVAGVSWQIRRRRKFSLGTCVLATTMSGSSGDGKGGL